MSALKKVSLTGDLFCSILYIRILYSNLPARFFCYDFSGIVFLWRVTISYLIRIKKIIADLNGSFNNAFLPFSRQTLLQTKRPIAHSGIGCFPKPRKGSGTSAQISFHFISEQKRILSPDNSLWCQVVATNFFYYFCNSFSAKTYRLVLRCCYKEQLLV